MCEGVGGYKLQLDISSVWLWQDFFTRVEFKLLGQVKYVSKRTRVGVDVCEWRVLIAIKRKKKTP